MGTEISLSIDDVDVCWSKNSMGIDHGSLFQPKDRKRFKSDQVNYDYFDAELSKMEIGFIKKLKDVIPRLELMGITLDSVRKEYNFAAVESDETQKYLESDGLTDGKPCMDFDSFLEIIQTINLASLDGSYDSSSVDKEPADYGKSFIDKEAIKAIPHYDPQDWMVYSEKSLVSSLVGFLSPYSALRLLVESKQHLDLDVKWQYGPLVENGWANASMFQPSARRTQKFLIVTEGHTDAEILDLAIKTLRPEIHDFFCFIDMTEGHPFGGTGNLQKFAKGLVKMDVQNKTLFLYDNDTEGLSVYRNTSRFNLPNNMRVVMLPDLEEFSSFQTDGPTGEKKVNINGKAVAIECYLDHSRSGLPKTPTIRWSGYKGDVKQYQGALVDKDMYTKDFLRHTPERLLSSGYDLTKLQQVVDMIFRECVKIACS